MHLRRVTHARRGRRTEKFGDLARTEPDQTFGRSGRCAPQNPV